MERREPEHGPHFGFELLDGTVVVERTLEYGVIEDGMVYILVANALDEGSCLPPEFAVSVDGLGGFANAYRTLAARSDFSGIVPAR